MTKLIEAVLPDQQTSNLTEDAEPEKLDSYRVEQNSSTENEADNLDDGGDKTSNSELLNNFCEMVTNLLNEKLEHRMSMRSMTCTRNFEPVRSAVTK